jgi:ABC-type nitrate/sulfonate/bicarbonate transport system permease component
MSGLSAPSPGDGIHAAQSRLRETAGGLAVFGGLLLAYEAYSRVADAVFFPSLPDISVAFWRTWSSEALLEHAVPSVGRMLAAYFLASVVGIVVGVLVGRIRAFGDTVDPLLQFLRAIPPPALVPVAVLIIGINSRMQVLVMAFGAVWPILLNATAGARSVPRERLDSAAVFGLSRPQVIRKVVLPSALPSVFAGLRVGLSMSLIMMVIAELTASRNGLGRFILNTQRMFEIPEMYAGLIFIGLLGFVFNAGFLGLEKRVLAWHYEKEA